MKDERDYSLCPVCVGAATIPEEGREDWVICLECKGTGYVCRTCEDGDCNPFGSCWEEHFSDDKGEEDAK